MKIVLCLHKYGVPLDDPCCYPLGFMYISSVLKEAGHDVTVLNYNLHDYFFDVEIYGADAVLFTGFEEFDQKNREYSAIARNMGIKTILGGALATFDTTNQTQYFDVVIKGEGEKVIEQALTDSGIIEGEKVFATLLPYPDYDGFGITEYHQKNSIRHIGILTSRGCPYNCAFCVQTCRFQMRPIRDVEQEIDHYLQKYQPDCLVFNDNTLNLNKERFMQICSMMENKQLPWTAAIRVDQFDSECAVAAKHSGCRYFVVGVESFNQKKLDRMNKKITVEQIRNTLDLLHHNQIGYHGNLIMGIDGESTDDIQDELNKSTWQKYNIFPVLLQPFTGTRLKRSAKLSNQVTHQLADSFRDFARSKSKYMYPELDNGQHCHA